MRRWNLRTGDPLSLFLTADARLCTPDYLDDQIWELRLSGGDPPALAVETVLGLRAVALRIFPVFVIAHHPLNDPARFHSRPVIRRFAPNYLDVESEPVNGLIVRAEYWVPDSHRIAGRLTFLCAGEEAVEGECWLACVLRPAAGGLPFSAIAAGAHGGAYLRGKTGNLHPVVALTSCTGIGRTSQPSIKAAFSCMPGGSAEVRWAFAGCSDAVEGLRLARESLAMPWEAEIARVEMANESLVDVETGDPEWDAILAFSQVAALQSVMGPTPQATRPSIVIGRNPERGFSLRADGGDYPPAWSGASVWDLLVAESVLGAVSPPTAKDILRNFLEAAGEGAPDARPGLGGQRAKMLCPPMLAQLASRIPAARSDESFLRGLLPIAGRCLTAWFDPWHDRDRDGLPEWDRADALGPEPPAIWRREGPEDDGIPPYEVEMPSLAALLYGECSAMARLTAQCGEEAEAAGWKQRAESLRSAIRRMETVRGYRAIDRETHRMTNGKLLAELRSGSEAAIGVIPRGARVLIRIFGAAGTRPVVGVHLRGLDSRAGECMEDIGPQDVSWTQSDGSAITRRIWKRIDSVRVEGPSEKVIFQIRIPGLAHDDLTNYLPLWGRVADRRLIEKMLAGLSVSEAFESFGGLHFLPAELPRPPQNSRADIWSLWNMLIAEAALRNGRGDLALRWMIGLKMSAANALRTGNAFRSSYGGGGATGPRNSVLGIFPLSLFLSGLGVFPLSGNSVWLGERSIFPFPVKMRFKGMKVEKSGDRVEISYASGKSAVFEAKERLIVSSRD